MCVMISSVTANLYFHSIMDMVNEVCIEPKPTFKNICTRNSKESKDTNREIQSNKKRRKLRSFEWVDGE